MERVYLIRKIAIEVRQDRHALDDDADGIQDRDFEYRKNRFKKYFDFDFDAIVKNVASNKDFALRLLPSTTQFPLRELGLFYIAGRYNPFRPERRLSLLHMGFNVYGFLPVPNIEQNAITGYVESFQHRKQTIANLFKFLREYHMSDILHSLVPDSLQSVQLKAILRPYQARAVRWLIHREIAEDTLSPQSVIVRSFESPDVNFYLQPNYLEVSDTEPENIRLPSGGILADEMGLGKTVEMLALFLQNRRILPEKALNMVNDVATETRYKKSKMEVRCLCGREDRHNTIQCSECRTLQHFQCTRKYADTRDDERSYFCPKCWERQPIVNSGTTIIVSPATIRQQWKSEILRHTVNVRVLIYDGVVVSGWINPHELSRYDIVLTDYNILAREIDFSVDGDTQLILRNKRKYVRKSSPLSMVEWWRVVLDEAQMVESGVTKCAQMLRKLPAIHRWAVTGTPIQKSIDDIRGLFMFLDFEPFHKEHIWRSLSQAFQRGDRKPLMDVLSKIMWRTCKDSVLEELGIPPQTQEVHYLILSDVQRLFYNSQHNASTWAFEKVIQKYAETMHLSQIDPRLLKVIMEPLRKLRQDCTVPVLFKKIEQSQVKKCLTPKELTSHLIQTNEHEAKNHLRCMASSINGQAALRIIRKEYSQAVQLYQSVLDLSEKYNQTISVDTLLQIHALHNLCEIKWYCVSAGLDDELVSSYRNCCAKLEWKYLSTYNDSFLKARANFDEAQQTCRNSLAKLPKDKSLCWHSLLVTLQDNNLDERFLAKIQEELALSDTGLIKGFRMIEGVSFFLTNWIDKMFKLRDDVLMGFQKLQQYIANIKPQTELTPEGRAVIEEFVKITFDCHLNVLLNNKKEKTNSKPRQEKQRFCFLCKAKRILDEYECVIYRKVFDDRRDHMQGSWLPTTQENICLTILRFVRANNINDDDTNEAGEFLKMMDCIKNEYKEFVKLWVEIEYTVKAYDEINMCKLRLQLYNGNDSNSDDDGSDKCKYQIKPSEVDFYLEELMDEYIVAESQFQKKLSRLKYIRHLDNNEEPGDCPICQQKPDSKYAMLQCGHHMCMMCMIGMKEYQRNILTCAVCRFRQKYNEVYFVTRKPTQLDRDVIEVKGQHSSKVEEIVRQVIRLKMLENNVKIIIFSHWNAILGVIVKALEMNEISCAFKENVTKSINLFKEPNSNITCLLLLLSQGSKGLNLTEATHVFIVEPILNPGEEQQAIGRVHRIGQTRPTTVHRFIMKDTIEEKIHNTISNDHQGKWGSGDITINNIRSLFSLDETS